MNFKEAFHYHKRAFLLINKQVPHLYSSLVLHSIVSALFPYVGIWMSAQILNELSGDRQPNKLWTLIITTLILTGTLTLLTWVAHHWKMAKKAPLYVHIRKIYGDKMLSMDYCVLNSPKTKELHSKILDNDQFSGYGLMKTYYILEDGLNAFFQILGGALMTITLFTTKVPDGKLTFLNNPLFILVIIILLVAVTYLSSFCVQKGNEYWGSYGNETTMGNKLFNVFGFWPVKKTNAEDVRIYNQHHICDYYNQKNRNYMPGSGIAKSAAGKMGIYFSLSSVFAILFVGLVYVFVCLKALGKAFGIGSVTQYVASITSLSQGFSKILEIPGMLKINGEYLKTTFSYLDIPNVMSVVAEDIDNNVINNVSDIIITNATNQKTNVVPSQNETNNYTTNTHGTIEFQDVSFNYPGTEKEVLSHISFVIHPGERLALVGENGSGKSTFIKLLCRLYEPTSGKILYNGIDIKKINYRQYLDMFSVVFQDFTLFSFPIGQNVSAKSTYDRKKAEFYLKQAGLLEKVNQLPDGIDTFLNKNMNDNGVDLSGGESQKLAIARALYKDSPIVIMDEPTASLDPMAEAEIYTKFSNMVENKTAIYISHRLSSCRFCQRIAVFKGGKIVETGNHNELVNNNGIYSELWNAQAQYYEN